MSAEDKLTPEQEETRRALLDVLNAYDAAPKGVQDEMRESVRSGSDYQIPQEYAEIGRAATTIREISPEKPTQQAIHEARTLREVGEQLPGVKAFFRNLSRRGPRGQK